MPLLLVSLVVVMVALGLSRGLWLPNLHNGLLALTLTIVGAYVLFQRPGHREGLLFMAAGVVEGVMFLGRQVGHPASSGTSPWWGWLGVWPLALALALTTFAVICFPDGRLPSPRWRSVAALLVAITVVCTALSAFWPVEYASAGMTTTHPIHAEAPDLVTTLWSAIAHPAYVGFQLLWVVALVARWRSSDGHVRRQLAWVAGGRCDLRGGARPRAGALGNTGSRVDRHHPSPGDSGVGDRARSARRGVLRPDLDVSDRA